MAEDHSHSNIIARIAQGGELLYRMPESRFPDTLKLLYHIGMTITGGNEIFLCPDATLPIGRPTGSADGRGAQCAGPVSAARHQLDAHLRA